MPKLNLVGVSDVSIYDGNTIIGRSKAMLDTSIDITTSSTEISGGQRNKLQNIYYHTARLSVSLTNTEWNMDWIKYNVGGENITWAVPTSESITIANGGGTVSGSPMSLLSGVDAEVEITKDDNISSYVVDSDGSFTIDDGVFTDGEVVCAKYYIIDSNATSITVPASIIPSRVRIVMENELSTNSTSVGTAGKVIFDIPVAQLSGSQTISMTADGYSNMPLTAMALAYTPTADVTNACATNEIYAVVSQIVYGTNWYDDIIALAVNGGDFSMTSGSTKTLSFIGVKANGTVPVLASELTITSSDTGIATVSNGVVSAVSDGTAMLSIKITDKDSIETNVSVEVTAAS